MTLFAVIDVSPVINKKSTTSKITWAGNMMKHPTSFRIACDYSVPYGTFHMNINDFKLIQNELYVFKIL